MTLYTLPTFKNFHTKGIVSRGVANIANHKISPMVSINSSVIFYLDARSGFRVTNAAEAFYPVAYQCNVM